MVMVNHSSLSLLSSTLPSSNYSPPTNCYDWPSSSSSSSSRVCSIFIRNSGLRKFKFRVSSKQQLLGEDNGGSAEQFLENNSIADFMRFIKRSSISKPNSDDIYEGRGYSSSELQTAVVSYRKKFPWSLLQPFLQVK